MKAIVVKLITITSVHKKLTTMESALIDLYDKHFKIMFRNNLYFTTKNYCICILNYMYNFSNECIDWFRVGMTAIIMTLL